MIHVTLALLASIIATEVYIRWVRRRNRRQQIDNTHRLVVELRKVGR